MWWSPLAANLSMGGSTSFSPCSCSPSTPPSNQSLNALGAARHGVSRHTRGSQTGDGAPRGQGREPWKRTAAYCCCSGGACSVAVPGVCVSYLGMPILRPGSPTENGRLELAPLSLSARPLPDGNEEKRGCERQKHTRPTRRSSHARKSCRKVSIDPEALELQTNYG